VDARARDLGSQRREGTRESMPRSRPSASTTDSTSSTRRRVSERAVSNGDEGGGTILYCAQRGDMTASDAHAQGLQVVSLIDCPDRTLRMAIWFGPDPDPGKLRPNSISPELSPTRTSCGAYCRTSGSAAVGPERKTGNNDC
jgi:hypothetical protein